MHTVWRRLPEQIHRLQFGLSSVFSSDCWPSLQSMHTGSWKTIRSHIQSCQDPLPHLQRFSSQVGHRLSWFSRWVAVHRVIPLKSLQHTHTQCARRPTVPIYKFHPPFSSLCPSWLLNTILSAPASPFAQPKLVIAGHLLSTSVAVLVGESFSHKQILHFFLCLLALSNRHTNSTAGWYDDSKFLFLLLCVVECLLQIPSTHEHSYYNHIECQTQISRRGHMKTHNWTQKHKQNSDYFVNTKFVTAFLPPWVASALTPALAISSMTLVGCINPPAGAGQPKKWNFGSQVYMLLY